MCEIVTASGADYIKTSTGFGGGGATREDVALFAKHIGPSVKIKAAGGIANLQDAFSEVSDPDMLQLITQVILQLKQISDEEFQSIHFVPDWEDEPGGEENAAFTV